jgi:hypothetical protein
MSVIQFDGKRRAGKDLPDAAKDLQRSFFGVLCGIGLRDARASLAIPIALWNSESSSSTLRTSVPRERPGRERPDKKVLRSNARSVVAPPLIGVVHGSVYFADFLT